MMPSVVVPVTGIIRGPGRSTSEDLTVCVNPKADMRGPSLLHAPDETR